MSYSPALELVVIFIALPLFYRYGPLRLPALPILWAVTGYALWQAMRDASFDRRWLWSADALAPSLPAILMAFAPAALMIWFTVRRSAPKLQWSLIRKRPVLWAVVMLAYPVLSVYPQGLLYRAFFFHRYSGLFPGRWEMIVASAAAFAFMHIIFRNGLAVVLTFAGGLLFAWRFDGTHSLAASSFEHALYGCWIFTVGLGQYFYHGTIRDVGSLVRR